MLVDIRRNIQKVAATAIIGLLVLAFASWGIADYITGFTQVRVASVNGKNITDQAFANARQRQEQRYRSQLGDNYQAGMLDDPLMKMALVQELIDGQLRIEDAQANGYRVSPSELTRTITEIEVFQDENGFNRELYQDLLQRQGLSISRFEKDLADSLLTDQVRLGLSSTTLVTDQEIEHLLKLQGEQRDIRFLVLPRESFAAQVDVSDEAINEFYTEHSDRFKTNEQVRIEYLEVILDDFAAQVTVDQQEIERLYNEQKNEYLVPGQRRANHLLISVTDDADDADQEAALRKISDLKNQLAEGADFAALAKEHSEDLGSARKGGDLGLFGRGIMDPEFEAAAFELPLNEVSDPVRSAFGYHLIQVTEIVPETLKPLAEVKDEISLRYRREQAEAAYFDATEALQETVYEQPDSLQPAADQFGLTIKQSSLFPRFGGEGITANSEVIEQAFSEDVRLSGQNSPVINIENSRSVVLRVVEHQPPATRPLAEVRDSIHEILLEEATTDAVKSRGEQLLEKLAQGESIDEELSGLSAEWQQREAVTRSQPGLPPALLAEIFRMPADSNNPVFQGLSLDQGDYVLYTTTRLYEEPLTATAEERQQLRLNLERLRGDIAYIGYLKHLRSEADIEIFPENMQ